MLYDVWFRKFDSNQDYVFVCDLEYRDAYKIAQNLEIEGFVFEAWLVQS
jgi:hypothetical protein